MDRALFLTLNGLATTPWIGRDAAYVAQYGIVFYPLLLLGLWIRGRGTPEPRRRILLRALFAAVFALGVNVLLNVAFPRPRPFLVLPAHVLGARPHDPSFPSDHAAFASAIAIVLLMWGDRTWGTASAIGALIIGVSRIIIGVHYPTDILGGFLVGMVCAAVTFSAAALLRPVLDFVIAVARWAHLT